MTAALAEAFASSAGPVLVVLICLSILSLALILAKAAALRGTVAAEPGQDTPVGRLMASAAQAQTCKAALEPVLERQGKAEIAALSRHLKLLEGIAIVAPLLGLLGTVLGMIEAFRALELVGGSANAAVLAGGIWQALLTTAAGLVVAIPALFATVVFGARIDRVAEALEDAALGLVAKANAA